MSDWTQKIINKWRGDGARKRKRALSAKRNAKRKRKSKRALPRKVASELGLKRDIFYNLHQSRYDHVSEGPSVCEFDVFARKPLQHAIHETNLVVQKPITSIDQSYLEFLMPADCDTYVDPDIKIYIRGKFTKADGTPLDATDHTAGKNNFLHSLFSQCIIALNGVNIT